MSESTVPPPLSAADEAKEVAEEVQETQNQADSDSVQLGRGNSPLFWVAFDPKWLRRSVLAIILLYILYRVADWIFVATANFLFLLLLAWLFGIALEPIVSFFARRGMKRGQARLSRAISTRKQSPSSSTSPPLRPASGPPTLPVGC